MLSSRASIYGLSLGLHLAGGAVLLALKVERPPEPVVIEVKTVTRPKPPPPPPETPPPPPEPAAAPAPKPAPTPAPATPAPAAAPDFGVAIRGAGPGGLAVPVGKPGGGETRKEARVLDAPKAAPEGGCSEEDVKAKPVSTPQPAYTEDATAAQIEGKVRVQIAVDAEGNVTGVKVSEGLGHGLDEAAVAAVRAWKFNPATRCGKPVASTVNVAVRFAL